MHIIIATSTIKSTDELLDEVILYNGKFWQNFNLVNSV